MKKLLSIILLVSAGSTIAKVKGIFAGSYYVPVQDVELEAFATLPIKNVSITASELKIKLPTMLASTHNYEMTFERSSENSNIYVSSMGRAHCLQTNLDELKCRIKYNHIYAHFLTQNLENTFDFIETISRKAVARSLAGDPLGILTISL